jgi:F-type H+-transporting ATPase subunit alpha
MEEQVASIFAVGQGLMDDVPLEEVRRFESEMVKALREMPSQGLKAIRETGKLEDDTATKLKEEISSFKRALWKSAAAPAASVGGGGAKAPEAPSKPVEKKAAH